MRAAPSLQVAVDRCGAWRAAVSLLAAGACAVMAAWWWQQPAASFGAAVASAALLATLACAARLSRQPPLTLRWDRRCWHVAVRASGPATAGRAGELAVAIDLGGWMLLRFVPEAASGAWPARRPAWIAVQRRGLEAHWHALRCALYAARPASPAATLEAPRA